MTESGKSMLKMLRDAHADAYSMKLNIYNLESMLRDVRPAYMDVGCT